MSAPPRVLVVGSVNMDMVLAADHFPTGGETVVADAMNLFPGGKGANQAVAAARLGAGVSFVGRVGADAWGDELVGKLVENGVDTRHVRRDESPTGTAVIVVEPHGENRIVVVPGANAGVCPTDVDAAFADDAAYDAILLQLEVPLSTVRHAIACGGERGIPVVLDAGPPQPVPLDDLRGLAVLSPNETETEALTGIRVDDFDSARRAATLLEERTGAQHVVLKLGADGSLYREGDEWTRAPAHEVDAVDTTAAGDSYTAALTIELGRGQPLGDSVSVASAAGAFAVTRLGAQPSLPTRAEVDEFLAARRPHGNS